MPYATGETPKVDDYVKNQGEQPGTVTRIHAAQDEQERMWNDGGISLLFSPASEYSLISRTPNRKLLDSYNSPSGASSGYKTPHNFRYPKKITHDSSGRLSRPRPFSQLGFSKVAPGLLLVMIDLALDPLIEVRKCKEIMSASHPCSCA
jgi:hypothetical protein